jgi:hypothetical protein
MPRYEIPLADLEALSVYLLSLNPERTAFRTLERSRLQELALPLEARRKGIP